MTAVGKSHRLFTAETGEKITAKIVRGRELTVQLQLLLRSATATEHDRRALSDEILSCFTDVITVLDSFESAGDEIGCPDHSVFSDLDSGNSRRIPAVNNIAHANKKRRLAKTRSIVTSATTEDAHGWRKYGQKVIRNATYPRSYYRCTHKYDQGCGATKQVQRMEHNSQMFKITYISNHTCTRDSPIVDASAAGPKPPAPSSTSEYDICYSDLAERSATFTDKMDVWSDLDDFGTLPETTPVMANHHYCFPASDDHDFSPIFWT